MHLNSMKGYTYFRTVDEHIKKLNDEAFNMFETIVKLNEKIDKNQELVKKLEKERNNS